ncbi:amidohydrolase family protein [Thauera aromatica]|uniref:amidohydrolase family protein n=1 Tax=Thauera aromatica TaxID=59405 RepID=UPI0032B48441
MDCQGATVIPGFNNTHCHPVAFVMTTRYADCSPPHVRSIADLIDALRARATGCGRRTAIRQPWPKDGYRRTGSSTAPHPCIR